MEQKVDSLENLKKMVINANGQIGERWYNNLTHTVEILQKHWSLSSIEPVSNMSWNYVAYAQQEGHPVVLKISADATSIENEYQALHHFSGHGVINVIDYNPKFQALLLQQAVPGTLLKIDHSKNIDTAIRIYADIVKKLSLPTHTKHTFQHVKEWCAVIDDIHDSRIPLDYIKKAKTIRQWLFETMTDEYICHGDLHLENIIKHENHWVAIDPKGVVGEIAFEAAAFDLLDKNEEKSSEATALLKERIQELSTALTIPSRRLTAWIFLRVMLSIQWFVEDKGDPTRMINVAQNMYPLVQ